MLHIVITTHLTVNQQQRAIEKSISWVTAPTKQHDIHNFPICYKVGAITHGTTRECFYNVIELHHFLLFKYPYSFLILAFTV